VLIDKKYSLPVELQDDTKTCNHMIA